MKKVIFVASSGGHLTEILRLEKLFSNYDYLLVTEKTNVTDKMSQKYNMNFLKYGPNKNILKYIFIAIYNVIKSVKIVINFKPETVVTTGAQIGGIMCLFAKMFGKKVIYIESLARVYDLSITGKNIYMIADKFYVQWEDITKKYKKAEYIGRLM